MCGELELGILDGMKIGGQEITVTLGDLLILAVAVLALVAIAVVVVLDYIANGRL